MHAGTYMHKIMFACLIKVVHYFCVVLCKDTPFFGDVRLTGFAGDSACGMVEVYKGSSKGWSTVCQDRWDNNEANVACTQLGYMSGTALGFYTRELYVKLILNNTVLHSTCYKRVS